MLYRRYNVAHHQTNFFIMDSIDVKKISRLLSEKLGRQVDLHTIERSASGFHSDGFKLVDQQGTEFFLKKLKSHHGGFEFPERRVTSLLVSDSMARRAGASPLPIGVIIASNEDAHFMHDLNDEHNIFHIQEFQAASESYLEILERKSKKSTLDNDDRDEIGKIVEFLSRIHAIKHPSTDPRVREVVYSDGIRSVITHPELTYALLQDFPDDHPHLSIEEQKRYLGLMWENVRSWRGRSDRLTALHGDFWGANVFFKHDGSLFVIDYSRIPWGDPGIDVGWWVSQYLWRYHKTGNIYFRYLGEEFFRQYIEKTGDKEIRKAVGLAMGFLGIVNIYPNFFPKGLDHDLGTRFISAVRQTLESKEFCWE